jgi:hypothetical protein
MKQLYFTVYGVKYADMVIIFQFCGFQSLAVCVLFGKFSHHDNNKNLRSFGIFLRRVIFLKMLLPARTTAAAACRH